VTLPVAAPHVEEALEAELREPRFADGRAEAAAFAAASTLAFIASSQLVPVGGPVAVAAGLAAFAPSFRRDRQALDEAIRSTPKHVQDALDAELTSRVLPGQPEDERVKAWCAWLPWQELRAGKHVRVPDDLPHPSCAGFEYTRLASRVGQSCDWACSLPDGSRLHAHEYPDHHVEVHRDKLDPAHGAGTAVVHWMAEAREGQLLAFALTMGLLAGGFALVNRGML
jgi:hypothetical protein